MRRRTEAGRRQTKTDYSYSDSTEKQPAEDHDEDVEITSSWPKMSQDTRKDVKNHMKTTTEIEVSNVWLYETFQHIEDWKP